MDDPVLHRLELLVAEHPGGAQFGELPQLGDGRRGTTLRGRGGRAGLGGGRRGGSVRFPLEKGSRKGYNFTANRNFAI